jgi:hypothetical protein
VVLQWYSETVGDFQKSETWTKSWKRENVVSKSQKWSKSPFRALHGFPPRVTEENSEMDGGAAGAPSPELMRWFCFLSLLHQHQCAEDDLIAAIAGWQSLRPPRVLEMSSSDAPKAPSMSASCGLWGGMADHTVALEFAMIVATATVAVAGVYCRGGRGDALYSSESSSDEESEETRSLPTFYRLAYQIKHLQSAQMPS